MKWRKAFKRLVYVAFRQSDSVGVRTQDPQLRRPTLKYNVKYYVLTNYEMKTKYNLFVFS